MYATAMPVTDRFVPIVGATRAVAAHARATTCSTCHLSAWCLPHGLTRPSVQELDGLAPRPQRVKAGERLYTHGDAFRFLYAVRRGTFKTSLTRAQAREQVSGFQLTGDLMGLDGAAADAHNTSAIALEDGEVCVISYHRLTATTLASEALQDMVGRLMSEQLRRDRSMLLLLGCCDASERLAAFLLNLSERLAARGFSAREFHLRMSRAEIGSFLGLTLETVSRTFATLQRSGLLEVDKRHITIVDVHRFSATFALRIAC